MELRELKGIGEKRLQALNDVGIFSCTDLINYLPYKYYDFTSISDFCPTATEPFLVKAICIGDPKAVFFKNIKYTISAFQDVSSTQKFSAVWYNQTYMKNNLKKGETYLLYGKTNNKKQLIVQLHFIFNGDNNLIIPRYKQIDGISQKLIRELIGQILDEPQCGWITKVEEEKHQLKSLSESYSEIHFPSDVNKIDSAKERISLEDMIVLSALEDKIQANKLKKDHKYNNFDFQTFISLCPFELTESQKCAINEIYGDMQSEKTMNRILLGDVGSGKTIVAFAACMLALKSGYSAVILSPTEILANQHYENAKKLFGKDYRVALLTSSLSAKEKNEIQNKLQEGLIDLLISTHSVLNDKITIKNLSLVVDDEQHRFGVAQRAKLSNKAEKLDQLHLSATPIPRSLALIFYGGLSISRLQPRKDAYRNIKTNILSKRKELEMWQFISEKINSDEAKCFVIVPRVENSADEEDGLMSINQLKDYLTTNIINVGEVGDVFGKQNPEQTSLVLSKFINNSIRVLIATTVVEVGVDIPSANIMVVYNAERFGLATLHQLRGRIGRDGRAGFCFAISNSNSEIAIKRLQVFKNNDDGEKIAEADLTLRGSGCMFGTKQHGYNEILASGQAISVNNFSLAKHIYAELSYERKIKLQETADNRFGDIYKRIVLN